MTTQNFLRIPKIILRKLCGEPKHAKTSTVVCLFTLKILKNHQKSRKNNFSHAWQRHGATDFPEFGPFFE